MRRMTLTLSDALAGHIDTVADLMFASRSEVVEAWLNEYLHGRSASNGTSLVLSDADEPIQDQKSDINSPPIVPPVASNKTDAVKKRRACSLQEAEAVLSDLNTRATAAGTACNYQPRGRKARELIAARMAEGAELEDFIRVHRNMVGQWGGSPKWGRYLRPKTLYGSSFWDYHGQEPGQASGADLSRRDRWAKRRGRG